MERSAQRRRLCVPTAHGEARFVPPLSAVPAVMEANAERARRYDYDVQGRPLTQLRAAAREELLRQARRYTTGYRDIATAPDSGPRYIVLGGHQPHLFHPGVWLKNFALAALARRQDTVAVNLLIDNDTVRAPAIWVPGGSLTAPTRQQVFFDRRATEIPYEERRVLDRELFRDFGHRAAETIRPFVRDPILRVFWPLAVARSRANGSLGQCLAQARHQLEGQWGLATLELPQSAVCRFEAFHWLTAHLLAQLPRFQAVYNGALAEYRHENRVRSAAHPAADLAAADGYLEAPFWIWTERDPQRRAVYVKPRGDQILISNRRDLEIAISLSPDRDAQRACQQLAELPLRAIKIRPRAVITTLFARLFLGDLFVHGIGGAKYDELTDRLIGRFFGLAPPALMVATATVRLPVPRARVTVADARRVNRMLRELVFHPECHIEPAELARPEDRRDVARLVEAKRRWIATPVNRDTARTRHAGIVRANAGLAAWVAGKRHQLLREQSAITVALRGDRILSSREYAFCLHPETALRQMLSRLCMADAVY